MGYSVRILADSIAFGVRLISFELTIPRFALAELNTHRVLSKNSASTRAIPVPRRIEQVLSNPFIPEVFGKNRPGMQSTELLEEAAQYRSRDAWLWGRDRAVELARRLEADEVHKQYAGRPLELWAWHTVVVTGTERENLFALRCHPAAQPEMQISIRMVRDAVRASTPRELQVGEWHLPYLNQSEASTTMQLGHIGPLIKASVARCAAVSYERQDAERTIIQLTERHDSLLTGGHMSPFEHQARVVEPARVCGECWYPPPFGPTYKRVEGTDNDWKIDGYFCGNFRAPWLQYRKTLPNESVFKG